MGNYSEIGLLLLLILAFSAPLLQNLKHRLFDGPQEDEES